jgi:alcohol dehydrogenase
LLIITGSHLAAFALSLAKMGLQYGPCHVLGGSANGPHRITNGVSLPHAQRFNFDATAPLLAIAGRFEGIDETSYEAAAEMAIDRVRRFIGDLELPGHLQELAINEQDLLEPGELAPQSSTEQANPKTVACALCAEADFRAA